MDITSSSAGIFKSILTIGNNIIVTISLLENYLQISWGRLGDYFVTKYSVTIGRACACALWPFSTNRHFDQIQFSSPSSNLEQERRHIQCSYQNYHVRFTDGFTLLVGTNIHYWDIPNFCQKGQKNESTLVAPDELKPGGERWNWY